MSRSHNHNKCPSFGWTVCTNGVLTGVCEYENCNNEYCSDYGHCECKCHSGKVCDCGYEWEKQ